MKVVSGIVVRLAVLACMFLGAHAHAVPVSDAIQPESNEFNILNDPAGPAQFSGNQTLSAVSLADDEVTLASAELDDLALLQQQLEDLHAEVIAREQQLKASGALKSDAALLEDDSEEKATLDASESGSVESASVTKPVRSTSGPSILPVPESDKDDETFDANRATTYYVVRGILLSLCVIAAAASLCKKSFYTFRRVSKRVAVYNKYVDRIKGKKLGDVFPRRPKAPLLMVSPIVLCLEMATYIMMMATAAMMWATDYKKSVVVDSTHLVFFVFLFATLLLMGLLVVFLLTGATLDVVEVYRRDYHYVNVTRQVVAALEDNKQAKPPSQPEKDNLKITPEELFNECFKGAEDKHCRFRNTHPILISITCALPVVAAYFLAQAYLESAFGDLPVDGAHWLLPQSWLALIGGPKGSTFTLLVYSIMGFSFMVLAGLVTSLFFMIDAYRQRHSVQSLAGDLTQWQAAGRLGIFSTTATAFHLVLFGGLLSYIDAEEGTPLGLLRFNDALKIAFSGTAAVALFLQSLGQNNANHHHHDDDDLLDEEADQGVEGVQEGDVQANLKPKGRASTSKTPNKNALPVSPVQLAYNQAEEAVKHFEQLVGTLSQYNRETVIAQIRPQPEDNINKFISELERRMDSEIEASVIAIDTALELIKEDDLRKASLTERKDKAKAALETEGEQFRKELIAEYAIKNLENEWSLDVLERRLTGPCDEILQLDTAAAREARKSTLELELNEKYMQEIDVSHSMTKAKEAIEQISNAESQRRREMQLEALKKSIQKNIAQLLQDMCDVGLARDTPAWKTAMQAIDKLEQVPDILAKHEKAIIDKVVEEAMKLNDIKKEANDYCNKNVDAACNKIVNDFKINAENAIRAMKPETVQSVLKKAMDEKWQPVKEAMERMAKKAQKIVHAKLKEIDDVIEGFTAAIHRLENRAAFEKWCSTQLNKDLVVNEKGGNKTYVDPRDLNAKSRWMDETIIQLCKYKEMREADKKIVASIPKEWRQQKSLIGPLQRLNMLMKKPMPPAEEELRKKLSTVNNEVIAGHRNMSRLYQEAANHAASALKEQTERGRSGLAEPKAWEDYVDKQGAAAKADKARLEARIQTLKAIATTIPVTLPGKLAEPLIEEVKAAQEAADAANHYIDALAQAVEQENSGADAEMVLRNELERIEGTRAELRKDTPRNLPWYQETVAQFKKDHQELAKQQHQDGRRVYSDGLLQSLSQALSALESDVDDVSRHDDGYYRDQAAKMETLRQQLHKISQAYSPIDEKLADYMREASDRGQTLTELVDDLAPKVIEAMKVAEKAIAETDGVLKRVQPPPLYAGTAQALFELATVTKAQLNAFLGLLGDAMNEETTGGELARITAKMMSDLAYSMERVESAESSLEEAEKILAYFNREVKDAVLDAETEPGVPLYSEAQTGPLRAALERLAQAVENKKRMEEDRKAAAIKEKQKQDMHVVVDELKEAMELKLEDMKKAVNKEATQYEKDNYSIKSLRRSAVVFGHAVNLFTAMSSEGNGKQHASLPQGPLIADYAGRLTELFTELRNLHDNENNVLEELAGLTLNQATQMIEKTLNKKVAVKSILVKRYIVQVVYDIAIEAALADLERLNEIAMGGKAAAAPAVNPGGSGKKKGNTKGKKKGKQPKNEKKED